MQSQDPRCKRYEEASKYLKSLKFLFPKILDAIFTNHVLKEEFHMNVFF